MSFLIDTNVLSEARRPNGHPAVREFLGSVPDTDLFLSVITIGEIAHGIARLAPGQRRNELELWFSQLEDHFTDRVLPIDRQTDRLWGELTATASQGGHTLHAADGLIAATALRHGLQLVTRNVTDFAGTNVVILNPAAMRQK